MYATIINEDKTLSWSEVPDPTRKEDEVIIEIHAAALNRADLMQREGKYPPPPGWPEWMGLEVAGTIAEAPINSRWKVGDAVCALLGGGGYAEKVAVPANMALPIPPGLSMVEAAAIPEAFATSYLNLCIEGGMKRGDTVFIPAGASGLGMAAIQLAKHIGATVITTVGTEQKEQFATALGVDIVINRHQQNILAILKEHPVDIAMDCVAGENLGAYLETMAYGGRWIVIATLGGAMTELDITTFFKRGVRLFGSTLRSRTTEMKARILTELERELWDSFTSGKIRIKIHEALPIARADEAHTILQREENLGKVILTLK